MAFELEEISMNGSVEQSTEYQKVMSVGGGVPVARRMVDRLRNASLYCLSKNGDKHRPPGRYLLFWGQYLTEVSTHEKSFDRADGSQRVDYLIHSVQVAHEIKELRADVEKLVEEALIARAMSGVFPAYEVRVVFPTGSEQVK